MTRDPIGEELAAWGKVLLLETRGRVTGRLVATPVGFVQDPDGAWRVAAGDPEADWALNLQADPRCRVTVGTLVVDALAVELDDGAHAATVRDLILKYGTPAERLGSGPAFRLLPGAATPTDRRIDRGPPRPATEPDGAPGRRRTA